MVQLVRNSSEIAMSQVKTLSKKDDVPALKTQKSTVSMVDSPPTPQEKVPALPVLVFTISYITFGAAIFSAWEQWSFLEGFYFSFITLTTIGKLIFLFESNLVCAISYSN